MSDVYILYNITYTSIRIIARTVCHEPITVFISKQKH